MSYSDQSGGLVQAIELIAAHAVSNITNGDRHDTSTAKSLSIHAELGHDTLEGAWGSSEGKFLFGEVNALRVRREQSTGYSGDAAQARINHLTIDRSHETARGTSLDDQLLVRAYGYIENGTLRSARGAKQTDAPVLSVDELFPRPTEDELFSAAWPTLDALLSEQWFADDVLFAEPWSESIDEYLPALFIPATPEPLEPPPSFDELLALLPAEEESSDPAWVPGVESSSPQPPSEIAGVPGVESSSPQPPSVIALPPQPIYSLGETGLFRVHTRNSNDNATTVHDNIQIGGLFDVDHELTTGAGKLDTAETNFVTIHYSESAGWSARALDYPYWSYLWRGVDTWVSPVAVAPGGPDWYCESAFVCSSATVPELPDSTRVFLMPAGNYPDVDVTLTLPERPVKARFALNQTTVQSSRRRDTNNYDLERRDTRLNTLAMRYENTHSMGAFRNDQRNRSQRAYRDSGTLDLGSRTEPAGRGSGSFRLSEDDSYRSRLLNTADYTVDQFEATLHSQTADTAGAVTDERLLDNAVTHNRTNGQITQTKNNGYGFTFVETTRANAGSGGGTGLACTPVAGLPTDPPGECATDARGFAEKGSYGFNYHDVVDYVLDNHSTRLSADLGADNQHSWTERGTTTLTEGRAYDAAADRVARSQRTDATGSAGRGLIEVDTRHYDLAHTSNGSHQLDTRTWGQTRNPKPEIRNNERPNRAV